MSKSQDGYALVTGASGGFGESFARMLARDKKPLILCARSVDKMEALAKSLREEQGVDVRVIPADLADPAGVRGLIERIRREELHVETLINNAGFGMLGRFAEVPESELVNCIRLNSEAPMVLSRAFLPGMIARRRGGILNVASSASFQPTPYMAIYGASKAFLLSLSESLWAEARHHGVHVTCLCPGPVKTGFQERAGMSGEAFLDYIPGMWLTSDAIAHAGLKALKAGKPVCLPGIPNRMMIYIQKLSTRRLSTVVSEGIFAKVMEHEKK